MTPPRPNQRHFVLMCAVVVAFVLGEQPAHAQGSDALLNGMIIGAAVGAGAGVAFTHAVRDSDLTFSQYSRGALIFGAIGAGVGLGVDALFDRTTASRMPLPRRVLIAPTVWRNVAGAVVKWRW